MPAFTQEQYAYQVQPPAPTKLFPPITALLMVLLIAGSGFARWTGYPFMHTFAIVWSCVKTGWIWQFFTYAFIDTCLMILLFDLSVFLFIGSLLERQHKAKTMGIFCVVMAFICGLLACLVMVIFPRIQYIYGGSGIAYGLVGAFGYCFRKQRIWMFLWTIEADKAAWLIAGFGIVLSIFSPLTLIFVAAAPIGWLYMKLFQGGGIRRDGRSILKPAGNSQKVRKSGFVDID
jgi:membrane associated rhomboid family serine protease